MDLKLNYINVKSANEAYEKIKPLLTSDYLSKLKVKANLVHDDQARTIKAEGKGFSLLAIFGDEKLELKLDLSLMLKALKGVILSKLENELKRHL